jgi:hypothetical protein
MTASVDEMDINHVDDFISHGSRFTRFEGKIQGENYARYFLMLKRLPAAMQNDLSEFIDHLQLYCDHEGKTYRCTGASRLGDILLTRDFTQSIGYDLSLRHKGIKITDCNNWRAKP